ncbi:MAG: flagellar hook-length control protein FliK [Rickettsiales bacterium]|nr:flagellar hook-length control protein FliK [Rickettsiales bacterium]
MSDLLLSLIAPTATTDVTEKAVPANGLAPATLTSPDAAAQSQNSFKAVLASLNNTTLKQNGSTLVKNLQALAADSDAEAQLKFLSDVQAGAVDPALGAAPAFTGIIAGAIQPQYHEVAAVGDVPVVTKQPSIDALSKQAAPLLPLAAFNGGEVLPQGAPVPQGALVPQDAPVPQGALVPQYAQSDASSQLNDATTDPLIAPDAAQISLTDANASSQAANDDLILGTGDSAAGEVSLALNGGVAELKIADVTTFDTGAAVLVSRTSSLSELENTRVTTTAAVADAKIIQSAISGFSDAQNSAGAAQQAQRRDGDAIQGEAKASQDDRSISTESGNSPADAEALSASSKPSAAPASGVARKDHNDLLRTFTNAPSAERTENLSTATDAFSASQTPVASLGRLADPRVSADSSLVLIPVKVQPGQNLVDQLHVHIHKAVADGNDQISLRLTPEHLGRIDISIDLADNGNAVVRITADRQDTFDLLQRDSRGLERALADAGIKADSGAMQFQFRGEQSQAQQGSAQGNDSGQRGGRQQSAQSAQNNAQDILEIENNGTYRLVASTGLNIRV